MILAHQSQLHLGTSLLCLKAGLETSHSRNNLRQPYGVSRLAVQVGPHNRPAP